MIAQRLSVMLAVVGMALLASADAEPRLSIFGVHVKEMARQRKVSVEDAVRAVRLWGYQGGDLWFSEEEMFGNAKMLAGGLKPATLIVFMDLAHTNDIARTEAAIAYAKTVGSPRIMLVPGYARKGEDRGAARKRMLPNLRDFVRRATSAGLQVDLEDFDASNILVGSQSDLRETFAAVPELGHVLDTGNYLFWHDDVLKAQRDFAARIRHVHIKDRPQENSMRSTAAGTGVIPVREVVANLRAADYRGWITFEDFGSTNMWDDVRLSAEYLRQAWNAAPQSQPAKGVDQVKDVDFSRYVFDAGELAPRLIYDAYRPIEAGSEAEIAIVLIHGWGGHVRTLLPVFMKALRTRAGSVVKTPYVIAPQFPRRLTMAENGEKDDGRAVWCDSWADEDKHPTQMGSAADDWRGGGDANGTEYSSYDYIDAIFSRFADRRKYPNLRKVVLAGFSAGGQFAGRYAATGKGVVREGVEVVYIAMSPSTEFRFEKDVPWLYGLKGRPRYSVTLTDADIMKNLTSRRVWRGCGSADDLGWPKTSLDITPPAVAQGANRFERFRNFERYLDRYPDWKRQVSFHVFEGIGHNENCCYPDPALLDFVFE